jgi:hypothetical protein
MGGDYGQKWVIKAFFSHILPPKISDSPYIFSIFSLFSIDFLDSKKTPIMLDKHHFRDDNTEVEFSLDKPKCLG